MGPEEILSMLGGSGPQVGTLALGAINTIKGFQGLRRLHSTQRASFSENPVLAAARDRAQQMSSFGYSPEEKAAFNQTLSRAQNTGYQSAMDAAPSLAQSISGANNYARIGAITDWAANDAKLHSANIRYADSFAQNLQRIDDMNAKDQMNRYDRAEAAFGEAAKSGMEQLATFVNSTSTLGGTGKNPIPGAGYSQPDPNKVQNTYDGLIDQNTGDVIPETYQPLT